MGRSTQEENRIRLDKPSVLILGAGATRGGFSGKNLPPPLDTDFFEIAAKIAGRGTNTLSKSVLQTVWNLYRRINGVSMEYYYRDIDSREKFTAFANPNRRPRDWENEKRKLIELIRRVYIHTTGEYDEKNKLKGMPSEHHKNIIMSLGKGDSIITFNYDLVVEESVEDSQKWNPKHGYGYKDVTGLNGAWSRAWFKKHNVAAENVKESDIQLFKLHGSINWTIHKFNKRIQLKPYPYHVERYRGAPRRESMAILAPGWIKDVGEKPYDLLWKAARKRLTDCKSIIIVGYSLPETDFFARSLFSEVVRYRLSRHKRPFDLKQLHIADIDHTVINRYVELFSPAMGPAGKVYKYAKGISELSSALRI